MRSTSKSIRGAAPLVAVAILAGTAGTAGAQLPSASPAALGMGDNYTAVARGFGAVAWNPANLALPGNPRFSLAILGLRGSSDLGPISTSDVARYQGVALPDDVREAWMQRIETQGGEQGQLGGGVTYLGLSVGHFAFQLSSAVSGDANLAPDAMELLLYGNAGRTGSPRDMNLAGAHMTGALTTTGAFSYGRSVELPFGRLALGATAKYIVGNALVHGEDAGSFLSANASQISVDFPLIVSDTGGGNTSANHGHGIGLDLGAAWQSGPLTAGLALQNIVNTFRWDASSMYYKPMSAYYGADTSYSQSSGAMPIDSAPAAMRDWFDAQRIKPTLAAGAAYQLTRALVVTADVRHQLGDGLHVAEQTHAGVGAELRAIPFIPLRVGVAKMSGGWALAGGTGVEIGPVNLTISGQDRHTTQGRTPAVALGVTFGTR
jgi:hypothetical protein